MWPWERKAYAQGYEQGRQAERDSRPLIVTVGDAVHKERAAGDERAKVAVDAMRRKLSELLWEARRDLPDDSPMHERIRKVLAGEALDDQLNRIEKFVPGSVKRK